MIMPKMMLMFAGMSVVMKEVANELLKILRNDIKQKRLIWKSDVSEARRNVYFHMPVLIII